MAGILVPGYSRSTVSQIAEGSDFTMSRIVCIVSLFVTAPVPCAIGLIQQEDAITTTQQPITAAVYFFLWEQNNR